MYTSFGDIILRESTHANSEVHSVFGRAGKVYRNDAFVADADVCNMYDTHFGYPTSTNPKVDAVCGRAERVSRNVAEVTDANVCCMLYASHTVATLHQRRRCVWKSWHVSGMFEKYFGNPPNTM